MISKEESIDNAFATFNTIITSLKALDEGFSSKNYVKKFLKALHPKWRAKVTAIKESKDLTSLSLDELIENLKVYEVIIRKDSEMVKHQREQGKSLALKMWRSKSSHRRMPKTTKNYNQRAFVGGTWSDSDEDKEEKTKDENCLMDQASNEKLPVCYDDDDDEESSNSLEDNIISELPPCVAITPDFSITDSLSIGDEHLDTIPTTKSDKFIKSSVENHVPIPSESEDECECDVPDCDDSQTTIFSKFSNPLFDDSTSSDDESSHEEDILEMSFKTYSNPLFDLDEEIISRIDKVDCYPKEDIHLVEILLYDNSSSRPPEEIVFDNSNADIESFSPSSILNEDSDSHIEEIDLSLNPDDPMPSSIEDDDHDSERDISILAELLENYSLSLPDNESYHFDIPSPYRPPAKPPDGKTGTLNIKMMGDNTPVLDVPLSISIPLDQLKYGGN
nr:zf-CCHC domain-containing protein/DUF4219 domain-containing protein/UBN2 domain-containing protein [Tanacetum cinerariifolium]